MGRPTNSNTAQTCERCGMQFYRKRYARKITTCDECPIIVHRTGINDGNRSRGHPVYDMTLELVHLRLAFEMIEPLLKMDRKEEAVQVYDSTKKILAILSEVEAPARDTSSNSPERDIPKPRKEESLYG